MVWGKHLEFSVDKLLYILNSQCSGKSPNHSTPDGFNRNIRVQSTCDCLMDDSLLFFFQQLDQLLFGADIAFDPAVGVIEEADDGVLFFEGREGNRDLTRIDQNTILTSSP